MDIILYASVLRPLPTSCEWGSKTQLRQVYSMRIFCMTRLLVQPLALSSQLSLIHEYHLVINGVLSCTILLPNRNQIHQRTDVPADHGK